MTRIGVCSWSLRPATASELVHAVEATGVSGVQIALDPIRDGIMPVTELARRLADAGIEILSGMMAMEGEDYSSLESIRVTGGIVPDATWEANLRAAAHNAQIGRDLGMRLVTFHAGFVPEDPGDARRDVLLDRIRAIAGLFAGQGMAVALETGQETAGTLLQLLARLDGVGVNFDPANMILYGKGDPVGALEMLLPHVLQVHVKDAVAAARPGTWGTEVPVGEGEVDWSGFFATLGRARRSIDLVIERESGEDRIRDVRRAVSTIFQHGREQT